MSNRKKWIIIAALCLFQFAFVGTAIWLINGSGPKVNDKYTFIDKYQPPAKAPKMENTYDVIVIGGEPEGVAAAVSAARNGAKTLLVEHRDGLGGLMTYGMLNYLDLPQGPDGKSVSRGVFEEWYKLVGKDSGFDIELAQAAFLKLVQDEPLITLSLNTSVIEPVMDADGVTVTGVTLSRGQQQLTVQGKRFIDATQDADFAAAAGAPYFVGGEDINMKERYMAVTPVIHVTGADWDGIKKASKDNVFGSSVVTSTAAYGFSKLHDEYVPAEENMRLRGLNIARVTKKDGDHLYINALQIFGVDGLDTEAKADALVRGNREIDRVVEFLRSHLPGFEQAKLAEYPTELYVRETRHVLAEYQLPMADLWQRKDHPDGIGFGAYPVDVQATSIHDKGYVISAPKKYAIPFRSLVPLKVDHLLVVGRSAGYSSIAAGSARVIPTGMTTGEAAGVAATLSIRSSVTFHEMSGDLGMIEELRSTLAKQGAYVEPFDIDHPYKGQYYDDAIALFMNYGLLVAGYENELNVDQDVKTLHFSNLLSNAVKRSNVSLYDELEVPLKSVHNIRGVEDAFLMRDDAAAYMIYVFANEDAGDKPWDRALELGLIDEAHHKRIKDNRVLTRAESYYAAYCAFKRYVLK